MNLNDMDRDELIAEYNKLEEKKKKLAEEFSKTTAGEETITEATSKVVGIGLRNHCREAGNLDGDMEEIPYTHRQVAMIDKYSDLKHKQQEIEDYAELAGF